MEEVSCLEELKEKWARLSSKALVFGSLEDILEVLIVGSISPDPGSQNKGFYYYYIENIF